jgi:probable DNA metabolism protein
MQTILYDGTFEGWLTAVFEVFEYKFLKVHITTNDRFQPDVFTNPHKTFYDKHKAERVWNGLTARLSAAALSQMYKAFLSEEKGMEDVLLQYVQYSFSKKQTIESDYSNSAVLTVVQTAKKVHREKHRMEAFIRFQLTGDGLFYAVCQPDFNVLPLIEKHFKNRYADQQWLIYDSKRKYGIYYNLTAVETVQLSFNENICSGKNKELILNEKELLYQQLWQQYFGSVNIKARKNTRLHIQHMPKRYWKYLPEKQPLKSNR